MIADATRWRRPTDVEPRGAKNDNAINSDNWTAYAEILFEDKTFASTKGDRIFCRTLAQGAFYAGASSSRQVLTHMLE